MYSQVSGHGNMLKLCCVRSTVYGVFSTVIGVEYRGDKKVTLFPRQGELVAQILRLIYKNRIPRDYIVTTAAEVISRLTDGWPSN